MAYVRFFNRDTLTTSFGKLEVGDYFKFNNELYVKLHEHKSPDYDKAVEEGEDPYDYKVNAFCLSFDDFSFFDDTDKVTPIFPETIQIEVEE